VGGGHPAGHLHHHQTASEPPGAELPRAHAEQRPLVEAGVVEQRVDETVVEQRLLVDEGVGRRGAFEAFAPEGA